MKMDRCLTRTVGLNEPLAQDSPEGVAAGNITARRKHRVKRLENIWCDLPISESPDYPCCAGTATAKPLLKSRGAGSVGTSQASFHPQVSQAAQDR